MSCRDRAACEELQIARRALAAVRKAKDENDERFLLERDWAREEHDRAREACARAEQEVEALRAQLRELQAQLHEATAAAERLRWDCGKLAAVNRL
jgi:chromosome segregation ATPase